MEKFQPTKPSALLIGKWQPWHDGHTNLFKEAVKKHGQVTIVCQSLDTTDDDVLYDFQQTAHLIRATLEPEGYHLGSDYIVMEIPRVAEISTGQSPDFDTVIYEDVEGINSSNLRKEINESEATNVG